MSAITEWSGMTIGNYHVGELLSHNRASAVYRAHQPTDPHDVAIKVLSPELAQQPGVLDEFAHTVGQATSLHHPNIEQVYDYLTHQGTGVKVMEYLPGPNLRVILSTLSDQGTFLPLPMVATIISQISSALSYANDQSQHIQSHNAQSPVHRGITPGNIMLRHEHPDDALAAAMDIQPSDVLLTDFGVARVIHDALQRAEPDSIPGLADYLAPELCEGKRGDYRADIYALGAILFELLTGTVPFSGASPSVVMKQHLTTPPPSPRDMRPELPEVVEEVVLAALAKDPNHRVFPSAQAKNPSSTNAFGMAVQQALSDESVHTLARESHAETRDFSSETDSTDSSATLANEDHLSDIGGIKIALVFLSLLAIIAIGVWWVMQQGAMVSP